MTPNYGPGQHRGICYFCLEAITGWREQGWDLIFQSHVCGPCIRRMGKIRDDLSGKKLGWPYVLDLLHSGELATMEARAWWKLVEDEERKMKEASAE